MSGTPVIDLLIKYTDFVSKVGPNLVDCQNATLCLSQVFNSLITKPNSGDFDAVWNFFVANHNGIVQESIALAGVNALVSDQRFSYQLLYNLFRQATTGNAIISSSMMVSVILKCPTIFSYLQQRITSTKFQKNGNASYITQSGDTERQYCTHMVEYVYRLLMSAISYQALRAQDAEDRLALAITAATPSFRKVSINYDVPTAADNTGLIAFDFAGSAQLTVVANDLKQGTTYTLQQWGVNQINVIPGTFEYGPVTLRSDVANPSFVSKQPGSLLKVVCTGTGVVYVTGGMR